MKGLVMENTETLTAEQLFSFRDAEASQVMLIGDFTHWRRSPIPLHQQSTGIWQTKVALTPGVHYYRYLVDGELADGPECTICVE